MIAYGSYNHIKQPVIRNSIIIAFADLVFAFLAGFIGFSVIGILEKAGHPAQYQSSGVGLAFIAFPTVAQLD